MNHAVIKNLWDLLRLIRKCSDFTPNARTVKFILSQPIPQIVSFLELLPYSLVSKLYDSVRADGYDQMRSYNDAAVAIAQIVAMQQTGTNAA